jgi:hypothetical protein
MKLKVPYYSQRTDVIDPEWKAHSCLVVCIKMVAEFLGEKIIPADDWLKEGTSVGAWDGKFWKHNEVIRLFRNHGISAYAQEFKTVDVDIKNGEMKAGGMSDLFLKKGIEKLAKKIDEGLPSIVSIYKYFTEKDRHHGIVIVGYDKNENGEMKGFYYHDPEMPEENGGENLFVEIDKFKLGWKRLVIFTEK